MHKIGIVILNYNTEEDTIECVNSIVENTDSDIEIIVVDNCSANNSLNELLNAFEGIAHIHVLKSERNGGYSYGNNIGIRKAIELKCNYILISNPDVIFYKNSIDRLLLSLISNPDVGVVGPSTESLDEKESQLYRKPFNNLIYFFSKIPFRFFRFFECLRGEVSDKKVIKPFFKFSGMVRGCCFMISSELFLNFNLFDDNVFLYSEEWIIAKKLEKNNLLCGCDFESRILHKEATSTNQKGTAFKTFHLYLSAFYYLKIYNHSSYLFLFFCYIQNVCSFLIRSIFNPHYRKMCRNFIKKSNELLFSNREITNAKNHIDMN